MNIETILEKSAELRYQLLYRLLIDCDYYLGYGNRNKRSLWAGNEKEQIKTMKILWESFSKEGKPEWLTYEQILSLEKEMLKT